MNTLSPVTGLSATQNNSQSEMPDPDSQSKIPKPDRHAVSPTRLPPPTDTFLRWRIIPHGLNPKFTHKAVWSRSNCSPNIVIEENPRFLLRGRTDGASTDVAISKQGFTHGIHIIEITWPENQRGTHAVLGLTLKGYAPTQYPRYVNLIGRNKKSCGWDLNNNKLLFGGREVGDYPGNGVPTESKKAPEKILCILNMFEGVLGFEVNGEYLGDAFSRLNRRKVHIAASLVWGEARVGIQYQTGEIGPCTLKFLSKNTIRKHLQHKDDIEVLPLPGALKEWLRV